MPATPLARRARTSTKNKRARRVSSSLARALFMQPAKLRKWSCSRFAVRRTHLDCKHARTAPPTGRRLQQLSLAAHQVLPCLPFSTERELVAADQRLGPERPRTAIAGHHKFVRAPPHDREQIPFIELGHLSIEREEIT